MGDLSEPPLVCGKKSFLEYVIENMPAGRDKVQVLGRGGKTQQGTKVLEIGPSKKTGGCDKGDHSTHPHKSQGCIGKHTIEIGMTVDASLEFFT